MKRRLRQVVLGVGALLIVTTCGFYVRGYRAGDWLWASWVREVDAGVHVEHECSIINGPGRVRVQWTRRVETVTRSGVPGPRAGFRTNVGSTDGPARFYDWREPPAGVAAPAPGRFAAPAAMKAPGGAWRGWFGFAVSARTTRGRGPTG